MTPNQPSEGWHQAAGDADPTSGELQRHVHDALDHLYDPVYLQTHPLTHFVPSDSVRPARSSGSASPGRMLSQALVDVIDALRPSATSAQGAHASRSHDILRLRFIEGLDVPEIADRLAISRSTYYLEQQRAIGAVADLLWGRWIKGKGGIDRLDVSSLSTRASERDRAPRHNLPLQLTSFVGREREMTEVRRLLGKTRLLTLTGTGGCGKTRLAYQVATELIEEYRDGVRVAELAALSDPDLVPQTVALALGLAEQPGQPIIETLLAYLRPSQLLLVLDNCEHLLDACAALAFSLLRSCPRVQLLATSREPLGITGEVSYRVPSLSLPDIQNLPPVDHLYGFESVRLFVERAIAVQPSFALTEGNALATAQICLRLDGMPLALELAAARVRGLSVEGIARHLDDRFRLLTGGSRTALRRQQTLRATIDWSYDLLSEPERMLFRRLAVFQGSFTLGAAEALCEGDERDEVTIERADVLDLILRLVDRSLVVTEEATAVERFHLLETLRQYASEKLAESGEAERICREHACYYLSFVERVEPELMGQRQRYWMDRLEEERANLRGVIQWSVAAKDFDLGLRMARALTWFYLFRGPYGEARTYAASIFGLPGARESALGPMILARYAWLTMVSGDQEEARRLLEEGCRLAASRNDRLTSALALYYSSYLEGHDLKAREGLLEAREMLRELGQVPDAFFCDWVLGSRSEGSGEFREAAEFFGRSLVTARELGNPALTGVALSSLASLKCSTGDLDEAWQLTEESLHELEAGGYDSYQAGTILIQARLLRLRGEHEAAWLSAGKAYERITRMGDVSQLEPARCELGLIASARGDYDLADRHLGAAQGVAANLAANRAYGTAELLGQLGIVARARGDFAEAGCLLGEGLAIARDLGARFHLALCLSNLGVVGLDEGKHDEARQHFVESLTLRREMGATTGIATSLECFGGLAALEGQPARALRLLGAGQRLRGETGNVAPPVWRRERDPWIERARRALEPGRADMAWAEGQAMTLEQAVEYALADEAES